MDDHDNNNDAATSSCSNKSDYVYRIILSMKLDHCPITMPTENDIMAKHKLKPL